MRRIKLVALAGLTTALLGVVLVGPAGASTGTVAVRCNVDVSPNTVIFSAPPGSGAYPSYPRTTDTQLTLRYACSFASSVGDVASLRVYFTTAMESAYLGENPPVSFGVERDVGGGSAGGFTFTRTVSPPWIEDCGTPVDRPGCFAYGAVDVGEPYSIAVGPGDSGTVWPSWCVEDPECEEPVYGDTAGMFEVWGASSEGTMPDYPDAPDAPAPGGDDAPTDGDNPVADAAGNVGDTLLPVGFVAVGSGSVVCGLWWCFRRFLVRF